MVARGRVSVYDPKGEYQIVCEHLEPEGLGALQLAFEQLKQRLAAEGLFDAARKRRCPRCPRKIGVVTSLDGAAVRDIIKVLRPPLRQRAHRHSSRRACRAKARRSTSPAPSRRSARCRGVDVVIVGRGGGSIEDLWAFNEEVVARAIAGCPVPTISAVGHETDVTIADFVADLRAPTPSAAAEMVVARKDDFCARHRSAVAARQCAMPARAASAASRACGRSRRGPAMPASRGRVAMRGRHAAELAHELRRRDARAAGGARAALSGAAARRSRRSTCAVGWRGFGTRLVAADGRLSVASDATRGIGRIGSLRSAAARLESLSPLAVLGRGYAVCWNADRHSAIIRDAVAHVARTASECE